MKVSEAAERSRRREGPGGDSKGREVEEEPKGCPAARSGKNATRGQLAPLVIVATLSIAPIASFASRLIEPLYGNVISKRHLAEACAATVVLGGFAGASIQRRTATRSAGPKVVSALAASSSLLAASPFLLSATFPFSGLLGPQWGPHGAYLLGVYPVFATFGWIVAKVISETRSPLRAGAVFACYALVTYALARAGAEGFLANIAPSIPACGGTIGIATVISTTVVFFGRLQATQIATLAALLFAAYLLSSSFHAGCSPRTAPYVTPSGHFTVVDHVESNTGFLSVVDEASPRDIRVLRAGHSLIGGVYRATWDSVFGSVGRDRPLLNLVFRARRPPFLPRSEVPDETRLAIARCPICNHVCRRGQFYFMEAVRLVRRENWIPPVRALQIGLGIGVSAKSLLERNVSVDVVELDKEVYRMARTYFMLPEPSAVYLEDGREFLRRTDVGQYDYVLHDVFTGGSLPAGLFSVEALRLVKRALKADGILALVFFASGTPLDFRDPNDEDFGESDMRYEMLRRMQEWRIPEEDLSAAAAGGSLIIDANNLLRLGRVRSDAAENHWKAMRAMFDLEFWLHF